MGLGGSKCCKDLCSTEEVKKPLVDPETGRVPRAGTGGGGRDDEGRWGDRGRRASEPVEPDPAVFYARPVSKARSQRRLVNNDTARETASDRRETRARKHHHRSNQKVGEETVLRFHQENPAKAPIVASSSEDDIGSKPPSEVKGQTDDVHIVHVSPAPSSAEKDAGKNWIGVCDAKLQHRVWWWSITFVLFFVIGMGVFLGLAHGYQPDHEDHPTSPLYPKVAVLDEESRHDTAVRHHHRREAPAAIYAPGPDVSTQMLSEWESMDRMWSDGADAAWKGGGDGDDAAELSKGWRARTPARSRKLTPGKSRRTPTPAMEEKKLDLPLEDPALKADLNAAVSRLLRKEIESVGTDAPSSTH